MHLRTTRGPSKRETKTTRPYTRECTIWFVKKENNNQLKVIWRSSNDTMWQHTIKVNSCQVDDPTLRTSQPAILFFQRVTERFPLACIVERTLEIDANLLQRSFERRVGELLLQYQEPHGKHFGAMVDFNGYDRHGCSHRVHTRK